MVLRGFVRDETIRRCLNGSGLRDSVSPCEKASHRVRDFAGRETKTYYFMRIDAAYYGKIRLVENAREKQDLVSFRYDKKSGKPTTVRDRLGTSCFSHTEPRRHGGWA